MIQYYKKEVIKLKGYYNGPTEQTNYKPVDIGERYEKLEAILKEVHRDEWSHTTYEEMIEYYKAQMSNRLKEGE